MRFIAIPVVLLAFATPADAGSNKAFAAAASPEQSFDICHADDVMSAISCAMKKCNSSGGAECVVVTACPEGWSGSMGVSTGEVEFTDAICGAPDKASVIASLTAFCKGSRKFAKVCNISSVWDPEGRETSIQKQLDPKKLK